MDDRSSIIPLILKDPSFIIIPPLLLGRLLFVIYTVNFAVVRHSNFLLPDELLPKK